MTWNLLLIFLSVSVFGQNYIVSYFYGQTSDQQKYFKRLRNTLVIHENLFSLANTFPIILYMVNKNDLKLV